MDENANVDLLVLLEQAKVDLVEAINKVGTQYNLPASLVIMMLRSIVAESTVNEYFGTIQTLMTPPQDKSED